MTLTTEWLIERLKNPRSGTEFELINEVLANREAQPVYQYRMRNPYNGQVTDWETIKPEQVDFILKETIAANVEFRIIAAPPAPAVPSEIMNCLAFFASVIKSGESWTETCQQDYDVARRAAMLAAVPEGGNG
ncbi:TPA: hypothetical protein ACIJX2_000159 [Serratia marcescens]